MIDERDKDGKNNMFPYAYNLAHVDRVTMVEVDRLMIEEYHIYLIQMMENAGRGLALVARNFLTQNHGKKGLQEKDRQNYIANISPLQGKNILIMAGGGGNGGGALTAGRRLAIWGAHVEILLSSDRKDMGEVPRHQLAIVRAAGLKIWDNIEGMTCSPDLIIEGLIGYSLQGTPRGKAADFIAYANASGVPILSLDVPAGFNSDEGKPSEICIKAAATVTLALPKKGLSAPEHKAFVGELYCADISVPPSLYRRLQPPLHVGNIFAQSEIVRVGYA